MIGAAYICDAAAQRYYICASNYVVTRKSEGIRTLVRRGIGCENNIKMNIKIYVVYMWTSYRAR
jgi:hypothetical protein